MVPAMRSASRLLSAMMAPLLLAVGLLFVATAGANAHPPADHHSAAPATAHVALSDADHAPTCASPGCHSVAVTDCCHMTGSACSGIHAICAADTVLAIRAFGASVAIPRETQRPDGRIPSVAQRPPALLA